MTQVTAAIIQKNDKYLVAQRPEGSKLAGKWEFPGGKVEEGETPEECLVRELEEEFSVKTVVKSLICQKSHEYDHLSVEVYFYEVELPADQELQLNEHQAIEWVALNELNQYDLVEADKYVVRRLITAKEVDLAEPNPRKDF